MSIACIVIASDKRHALVKTRVLPSVLAQGFDEVAVVGDYELGAHYRYFHVPNIAHSTVDALVKRDVGTVATVSDVLVYLCDDHRLSPTFLENLRIHLDFPWDVLVPARFTVRDAHTIPLNSGAEEGYCGGHAGIFRRPVVMHTPWTAQPHHPNWDLLSSHNQASAGFRFMSVPSVSVEDVELGATPWR